MNDFRKSIFAKKILNVNNSRSGPNVKVQNNTLN